MFYVMLVDLCCWVKSYFVFCGTIKVVRYTTRFSGYGPLPLDAMLHDRLTPA